MRSYWLALMPAVIACAAGAERASPSTPRADTVVIDEAFLTPFDTADNVDSPAWYGGGERPVVYASAKTTNVLLEYDAATGSLVRRFGSTGSGDGQFLRPNGLAVADSLLFVVERDNHRIQVLHLPSLRTVGTFGVAELKKPYGIAWLRSGAGWDVWVTDNYETADEATPPDRELGERVRQYRVAWSGARITGTPVRAFGDTTGAGVLRVVESIAVDSAMGRLLIAEEDTADSHIKVYDLEGRFAGTIIGRGLFPQQAEGIALYPCGVLGGWWIATDQGESINTFHVFDRVSLEHLGAFTGTRTRLTDGIAITDSGFGSFTTGALYASHLDGGLGAISWERVSAALGLRCERQRQ